MHVLLHSVPPTLQQATTNSRLRWRLLMHSQASLGQSLVGSLLPSPGSGCTRYCLSPPRVFFNSCVSPRSSVVGLKATSSKRFMPYPSLLHLEPLSLWQSTADLYLHGRCSDTVLSQSLWSPWVLVRTRFV